MVFSKWPEWPLSIESHFSDFGSDMTQLRKKLRGLPHTEPLFDSFPPYGAAFRRRFGLQNEQALELFHQTISMKSVGNLTAFVREHMLEALDMTSRIEGLINHFEDLNRAHEAVLRAKKQIEKLTPLISNLDEHEIHLLERNRLRMGRDSLSGYFGSIKADLLKERIAGLKETLEKLQLKKERFDSLHRTLQSERDDIRQAISKNGGDRLESLKKELTGMEHEKQRRLHKYEELKALYDALELPGIKTSGGFIDNKSTAEKLMVDIRNHSNENRNLQTEQEVDLKNLKTTHAALETEVQSLKNRKSNIEYKQVQIRKRLCDDLNLSEDRLPFVGELIAVREEESLWEGAVERLLRNFGLSLLVPEELYGKVSRWVDKTNLRGRLVYYKVDVNFSSGIQETDSKLIFSKVRVKTDSLFRLWLEDQLIRRFDYICCESLEEFRKARKGITVNGQIKSAGMRHEKDDRYDVHDRRRFVLGWTNLAKIAALIHQRKNLEKSMAGIAGVLSKLMMEEGVLEEKRRLLNQLEVYSDYEDVNWRSKAEDIQRIQSELAELKAASDILESLNKSLSTKEGELLDNSEKLNRVTGEIARNEERNEQYGAQLREAEEEAESLSSFKNADEFLSPMRREMMADSSLTVENCDKSQRELLDFIQQRIDSEDKRLKRLEERIIKAMENFRRDYSAETREVDASLDAGDAFKNMLRQLKADDLPRFEQRFKEQLNENTIREIAGFQSLLNQERSKIQERIDRINKSMSAIEYNRDRYIQLEALSAADPEIRGFRGELKSCTEGSFTGSDNEQYTESKFLQVKSIVNRFKGREGTSDLDSKWTAKVTDVRQWFAFAASERWKEDDSEYEHYTDSGGKSGGQKEKLAYTILAASLAYQFGLEWGEVRSRSFRFVVIDEAFGRGSDESAHFGLELFKRLNLQLLIITPLQKIHIIEPYVSTVGFVHNQEGRESLLRCITIEEYQDEMG